MTTGRVPRNVQPGYTTNDLLNHLKQTSQTIASCYKLVTADGVTKLGYTSHTRDITLAGHAGVNFSTKRGLSPTNVSQKDGLALPNATLDALFSDDGITEAKVDAGVYDGAEAELFLVNYEALGMGELVLLSGPIGRFQAIGQMFRVEALGRNAAAQQKQGSAISPTCRVKVLGDSQCKRSLVDLTHTGTALSVADAHWIFTSSISVPDGKLDFGWVEFTSGANAGLGKFSISFNAANVVTLEQPTPYAISPGDGVTLVEGCNRSSERCIELENMINFHGEGGKYGIPQIEQINRIYR